MKSGIILVFHSHLYYIYPKALNLLGFSSLNETFLLKLSICFSLYFSGVLRDQLETYAYNYYIAGIVSLFGFGCLITILGYMQRFSQATRKQKNSFR